LSDEGVPPPQAADPFGLPPMPYVLELDSAARRAEQRRRATVILGTICIVVVIAAVIAAVSINRGGSSSTADVHVPPGQAVPSGVMSALTGVQPSVETAVGSGSSYGSITAIQGVAPASTGTPNVLFVGGEFCPYCAAERWSIIQAFSRFGTFSGLAQIRSSEDNLPTFDFASAHFTSKYVGLSAVEIIGENHQPLQHLTSAQQAIFAKYSQDESFPFLYFDGKYVQDGAGFNPSVLAGLNQRQVAAALDDPSSPLTKSIVGEANVLTAAVCDIDGAQPSSVCDNPAVSSLQAKISGAVQG
jgi:hypothetical protein